MVKDKTNYTAPTFKIVSLMRYQEHSVPVSRCQLVIAQCALAADSVTTHTRAGSAASCSLTPSNSSDIL